MSVKRENPPDEGECGYAHHDGPYTPDFAILVLLGARDMLLSAHL